MKVAVPKESRPGECRVALVPKDVAALRKRGAEICVEMGAGSTAYFSDAEFSDAGASLAGRADVIGGADLILTVNGISGDDAALAKQGAVVAGFLAPMDDPQGMQALASQGLSLLSVEMIPRITRAQAMDALSSMATVAGYKAVLLAACTRTACSH